MQDIKRQFNHLSHLRPYHETSPLRLLIPLLSTRSDDFPHHAAFTVIVSLRIRPILLPPAVHHVPEQSSQRTLPPPRLTTGTLH